MKGEPLTPRGRKLTPWYPPHVKPVRVGLYQATVFERAPTHDAPYMYWDGKQWMNPYNDGMRCMAQDRAWRGLARRPR